MLGGARNQRSNTKREFKIRRGSSAGRLNERLPARLCATSPVLLLVCQPLRPHRRHRIMRPQVANDHDSFLVERSMYDRLPMAIFGAPKSRCTSMGALTGVIDIDDSLGNVLSSYKSNTLEKCMARWYHRLACTWHMRDVTR
jgi:hypothetical protein